MLTLTNFSKTYPGNTEPVLSIAHFELGQGTYWIKGENGSGKTSLLKSVAGLVPFSGQVSFDGVDINKSRMAYAQMVNYAEAEPQYPPFLTGKELVDFYLATKGGQYPAPLAKSLGVEKFLQQKTATCSSGMLKKLSLVLAFTGTPKLVLLDEPLIALDVAAVDALQAAIKSYGSQGVMFLITSHQALNNVLVPGITTLLIKAQTLQRETK